MGGGEGGGGNPSSPPAPPASSNPVKYRQLPRKMSARRPSTHQEGAIGPRGRTRRPMGAGTRRRSSFRRWRRWWRSPGPRLGAEGTRPPRGRGGGGGQDLNQPPSPSEGFLVVIGSVGSHKTRIPQPHSSPRGLCFCPSGMGPGPDSNHPPAALRARLWHRGTEASRPSPAWRCGSSPSHPPASAVFLSGRGGCVCVYGRDTDQPHPPTPAGWCSTPFRHLLQHQTISCVEGEDYPGHDPVSCL